jgi:2-methylisocitrate lyase-like PEP mutase family enzyme
MLEAVGRGVDAVDLPVTADLEAGAATPPRRYAARSAWRRGMQHRGPARPVADAAAIVESVMQAAAEGVPDFVLNAAPTPSSTPPAADLTWCWPMRSSAVAPSSMPAVVFVPGRLSEDQVVTLVDALGPPADRAPASGEPSLARLEESASRASLGPFPQRVALTALQEMVEGVARGEAFRRAHGPDRCASLSHGLPRDARGQEGPP